MPEVNVSHCIAQEALGNAGCPKNRREIYDVAQTKPEYVLEDSGGYVGAGVELNRRRKEVAGNKRPAPQRALHVFKMIVEDVIVVIRERSADQEDNDQRCIDQ